MNAAPTAHAPASAPTASGPPPTPAENSPTPAENSPSPTPAAPAPEPTPRRLQRRLLCLGGGILTALAFPPYDYSILVWFALIPLLSVIWTGPAKFWPNFRAGWLYGMGWYCVSFWWITEVSQVFPLLNNCFGSTADMPSLLADNPNLLPTLNKTFFTLIAFLPLMALYALLPALWAGIAGTLLRPKLSKGPEQDLSNAPHEKRKEAWSNWAAADTRSNIISALALGALWVCIEWLRAHYLCLGFSWNSLGSGLYAGLAFAQWAEYIGVSGLSIIPAATCIIIWGAARRAYLHQRGIGRVNRPWDFYATVIALFVLFLGGLIMARQNSVSGLLAAQQKAEQNGDPDHCLMLPVLAVQINLDQVEKMSLANEPSFRQKIHEQYINLTGSAYRDIIKRAVAQAGENQDYAFSPRLPLWVIWPESALPDHLWRDVSRDRLLPDALNTRRLLGENGLPGLRQQLAEELGAAPFVLLAGGDEILLEESDGSSPRDIPMSDGRHLRPSGMYNSLLIMPDGLESAHTTAKQHLMPFGEYIPLVTTIEWIGSAYSALTGTQVGDGIRPGSNNDPISVPLPGSEQSISIIPAVCYEDTVGDLLTKFVRPEAQVIVNVTNDAWFRNSSCGEQQARAAAFRCIELRRPMVRAANMGVTCCLAPNGAPIDELRRADGRPWTAGYSYAELPVDLSGRITLYARWGDWFSALCALGVIALITRRQLLRRATRHRRIAQT